MERIWKEGAWSDRGKIRKTSVGVFLVPPGIQTLPFRNICKKHWCRIRCPTWNTNFTLSEYMQETLMSYSVSHLEYKLYPFWIYVRNTDVNKDLTCHTDELVWRLTCTLKSGWVEGNVIRSLSCTMLMEPVELCVLKLTLSPSASLLVNNSFKAYLYFWANKTQEKLHALVAVYLVTFTWPFVHVGVTLLWKRKWLKWRRWLRIWITQEKNES
jgi:hypothetical protein